MGNALGIFHIIDGIMAFVGICLQIEIKLPTRLGIPDVLVVSRHNKMHRVHTQSVLAVDVFTVNGMQHAFAVHGMWDFRTCQLQQCGHYIPQLHQIAADTVVLSYIALGTGQEHGYLNTALIRLRFLEEQMVSKHFAMVRHKQDNGVGHQLLLHQGRNKSADLVIYVGNGTIIANTQLTDELRITGAGLSMIAMAIPKHTRFIVPITTVRLC